MAISDLFPVAREPLLRVRDASARLSMSRSAIYLLMDRGELAFVKIGRCRRIRAEDVERLIASGTVGS